MENTDLKNIIEAILFSTGREVSAIEISNATGFSIDDIQKSIEELIKEYLDNERGMQIIQIKESYQLISNKKYYEYIIKFFADNRKPNLSNAALEVLAIIAYNSNITRMEIEKIRGVNSDGALNRLLEYGIVEEAGRLELPGRPAIYKTTDDFLRVFGLSDLSKLPVIDIDNNNNNIEEIIEDNQNDEQIKII